MLHESLGITYESVMNMRNAAQFGHKLTEIRDDCTRFARFSLTIAIKKARTCFGASVPK